MEDIFMKLVSMSVSASWLVLVVLLLRRLLNRAPRWLHVCLWALVAVRLVCPFSLESTFSLVPMDVSDQIVASVDNSFVGPSSSYWDHMPEYEEAIEAGIEPILGGNGHYYVVTGKDHQTPVLTMRHIFGWGWLMGMIGMLFYAFISYRKLCGKVAASLELTGGVYLCDYIDTPFILGVVKPKIYLPSTMDPRAAAHVLAHERAHIQRRDHWWKPLGFCLLALHWFNPAMWLAYVLLCRDIELACDEKVIREMGAVDKKSYSEALLSCSVPRHMIAACPLAFGEVGVKERVKSVLNYKKPAFWIILVAVVACIAVAVCFLTDPVADPFGKTYQVNEVLYRHPAISFYVVPKDAPLYDLTEDGELRILEDTDSENWLTPGEFERISLTEDNFDVYLEMSLEADFSPAGLREENRKAWVLYVNDLEISTSSVFYYLLMQDNGDVYFVQGTCSGRVEDGGIRSISSIYKLGEETSNDPFASAEMPYQWTRNLGTEFVEWMQVTAYNADGTQRRFTLGWAEQAQLVRILNDLSPDDFELSHLSDQNTVSCYVACKDANGWNTALDVNLRFDGDQVDMSFGSEESAQRYETANSRTWVIRKDALNAFFSEYVDMPEGDDPYAPADTPYQWTSNVTVEDVIIPRVTLYEEETYTYTLTNQQMNTVISVLNQVPEADIQVVNYNDVKWKHLDVQLLLWNAELQHVYLFLTDYGVLLSLDSSVEDLYPGLSPEDNWFIRNEALEQALRDLSYGGTYMLSNQNRQAVKNTLGVNYAQFFDPQIYDDLLFVGCIYGDDQTGLAVFESDGNGGYTLQRVTQYEYLSVCPEAANVWLDRYIADGMNLYVFVNRNDILRQIQWIGEFETTVSAGNDPNLIIVDVPKDAKTEYRFVYGKTGVTEYTGTTAGKPFVASAEYAYQYANMKLSFFEGWEYQIVEYSDEYTPFGIRFRPEGEDGWLFLQFRPNGLVVCGTGLETVSGGMSNGYMTEHGYYYGNDIWSFIRITDMPGSYTVLNEGADSWIPEYEADLQTILENMVVAEGYLDNQEIQFLALNYACEQGWHEWLYGGDQGVSFDTRFDFRTGTWTVQMTKSGSDGVFMCEINAHGVVQNEE